MSNATIAGRIERACESYAHGKIELSQLPDTLLQCIAGLEGISHAQTRELESIAHSLRIESYHAEEGVEFEREANELIRKLLFIVKEVTS